MEYIKKELGDGIDLISVPADRFKTNLITFSFAIPLRKETAAVNSLLIGLLARRSADYPDMTSLNKKLAALYGASVTETISKIGENQVVSLEMQCLDDRFSLDGESIALESLKLVSSLVFSPKINEKGFLSDDVKAEKRILKEKIESENNEKRIYVLRQAESLMFKDEPYAVNKYGTPEDIDKLTGEDVYAAWKNLLKKAKIRITVVGSFDADRATEYISGEFSKIDRAYEKLLAPVFVPKCDKVKEKLERIDVKQGKLVIGFRVNAPFDSEKAPALRSFCDIFGGGPYSKLFANVREKMSLCYYCSARYTRLKSNIMIQCGCLEENMDKALDEILNQLDEIKKGNFEEEFESSRMALIDAVNSVADTPETLEGWYINQISDETVKSLSEVSKEIGGVTFDDVKACADLLTLDTVYKLAGEEAKAQ